MKFLATGDGSVWEASHQAGWQSEKRKGCKRGKEGELGKHFTTHRNTESVAQTTLLGAYWEASDQAETKRPEGSREETFHSS